jgi:hypothetical protein
VYSQVLFPFWDDQDNLHASVLFNPAYIGSNNIIAVPSITSSNISNAVDPEGPFEIFTDAADKVFGNQLGADARDWLTNGADSTGVYASHTRILGGGISFHLNQDKRSAPKRIIRVGYISEDLVDFTYGNEFAQLAVLPRFSREIPYGLDILSNVEYRKMDYSGLVVGYATEVSALQTYIGGNVKLLNGREFAHARMEGERMVIEYSGADFVFGPPGQSNGFFDSFGVAIDVGASHRFNRNWTLSVSVVDLGFIRWANLRTTKLNNSAEVLLGLSPINELTNNAFLPQDYGPLLDVFEDGSAPTVRTANLDGRLNIAVNGEFGKLSGSAAISQAVNESLVSIDRFQGVAKLSYSVLQTNDVLFRLSGGARYGSDTELGFSTSLRAEFKRIDLFLGIDGIGDSGAPYGRNAQLFGIQYNLSSDLGIDRL